MNTEGKAHRTLDGTLLRPLAVGAKAVILHNGQVTLTSRVMAVHRITEDAVEFETRNTEYRLLTGPIYGPAVSQFSLAMAA